jgi:UDP-2,3-diacylglucosamine pyrophosphatase LpxH/predicted RNA-binding Zn-ribbon protein involved in translation (DUF1610 family)
MINQYGIFNGDSEVPECGKYVMLRERFGADEAPASDEGLKEYLQELANQLSSRNACVALGWSSSSFGSLNSLYELYEIDVPVRSNQHDMEHTMPDFDTEDMTEEEIIAEYGVTTERLPNGDRRSDRLIKLNDDLDKDDEYLLLAHGFDPKKWELISAKNKQWQMASKKTKTIYTCPKCKKVIDRPFCPVCRSEADVQVVSDGHDISTLYASAITVKPLTSKFDIQEIANRLKEVEPMYFSVEHTAPDTRSRLLEISLVDMHVGLGDLTYFEKTVERIIDIIASKRYTEILLTVGSDLFHHDNFKATTSNGTPLEEIDWTNAWFDASTILSTIIEAGIKFGVKVTVYYIKGNHDESMSWAFCQMLAVKYPQVTFDLEIRERKVYSFGEVCIGYTHGDKGKDLDRIFMAEFPEFAAARIKEIHAGHYHHEIVKDMQGVMVRNLPAKNVIDKYHLDRGFVGTMKRFQVFEYEPTELVSIYYV